MAAKRARTESADKPGVQESNFFPGIPDRIPYVGPDSKEPLGFKYYNPEEVVLGRKLKDWCRFAVCYWHTWRGGGWDIFGPAGTIHRSWDDGTDSVENARRRVRVHFEFLQKLGVDYYCFHDADVAPAGRTPAETLANFDAVVETMKEQQEKTGKKLLWGTANLFSHERFMCGASTNPDPKVFAYAAFQVKKALEVTKALGGENYVLWGGREGYQTIFNTKLRTELDNFATFLKLVVAHKKKIGFTGTLLIEPKPREPTSHQYDFDAATVMGFLRTYGLENEFKLNIESNHGTLAGHTAEHEVEMSSAYGMLGSIDANHNESMLGWDTDMFPTDIKMAVMMARTIVKQGGLQPGGLNFDAKVRRESVDIEDLFIGHIVGMDTMARGFKIYEKMVQDKVWEEMLEKRYADWSNTDLGKKITNGEMSLEDLSNWAIQNPDGPTLRSGKEETLNGLLNAYI